MRVKSSDVHQKKSQILPRAQDQVFSMLGLAATGEHRNTGYVNDLHQNPQEEGKFHCTF